jgi:hypothetical protein
VTLWFVQTVKDIRLIEFEESRLAIVTGNKEKEGLYIFIVSNPERLVI